MTCGRSMGYGAGTTSSEGSEEGLRAKVVLSHLAVLDQAFVFTFRAFPRHPDCFGVFLLPLMQCVLGGRRCTWGEEVLTLRLPPRTLSEALLLAELRAPKRLPELEDPPTS